MNRRESLTQLSSAILAILLGADQIACGNAVAKRRMTVYKSPACGCCKAWVSHVRANAFTVEEVDIADVTPYKRTLGVPSNLASCHTAVVDGFAFEGHVPADLIDRFLRERPKNAKGLAVPGMPIGSPGMEAGTHKQAYDVVMFTANGTSVYARR